MGMCCVGVYANGTRVAVKGDQGRCGEAGRLRRPTMASRTPGFPLPSTCPGVVTVSGCGVCPGSLGNAVTGIGPGVGTCPGSATDTGVFTLASTPTGPRSALCLGPSVGTGACTVPVLVVAARLEAGSASAFLCPAGVPRTTAGDIPGSPPVCQGSRPGPGVPRTGRLRRSFAAADLVLYL